MHAELSSLDFSVQSEHGSVSKAVAYFNLSLGLPWQLRRESICLQCGRPGFDPWVGKIPWRRKWQPTPVLLPRKFHGRRSLVQATVHGVAKSPAQLSNFTFSHLSLVYNLHPLTQKHPESCV